MAKMPILDPGTEIDGKFILQENLGSQEDGDLYLAKDKFQGRRDVRLKLLRPGFASHAEAAANVQDVRHPNIDHVLYVGEDRSRQATYIVTSTFGETLHHKIKKESLDVEEAARIGCSLADALHSIHKNGILHTNLTIDSILFSEGEPRISNFEYSVVADHRGKIEDRPRDPQYSAPELKEDLEQLTIRSDIFSLGVVLYILFCRKSPFPVLSTDADDGYIVPTLVREVNPKVPHIVARTIERCLSGHIFERPASAQEIFEDLSTVFDEHKKHLTIVVVDAFKYSMAAQIAEKKIGVRGVGQIDQDFEDSINEYLEPFQTSVENKFIQFAGDGVIIPFTDEDDAFAFSENFQNGSIQRLPQKYYRIGIASGQVLTRNDKLSGYTLTVAHRIESAAYTGQILVDKETFSKLDSKTTKKFHEARKIRAKHNNIITTYPIQAAPSSPENCPEMISVLQISTKIAQGKLPDHFEDLERTAFGSCLADHGGKTLTTDSPYEIAFRDIPHAMRFALSYREQIAAIADQYETTIPVQQVICQVGRKNSTTLDDARDEARDIAKFLLSKGGDDETILAGHAFNLARRDPDLEDLKLELAFSDKIEIPLLGFDPKTGDPRTIRTGKIRLPDSLAPWAPAGQSPVPASPRWILQEQIGTGGYSEVWLAANKEDSELRAFKFFIGEDGHEAFEKELETTLLVDRKLRDHKDLIHTLGYEKHTRPPYIAIEYFPAGDLMNWFGGSESPLLQMPRQSRLELAAKIADAIAAIHGETIFHGDLKPSNVLIQFVDNNRHNLAVENLRIVLTDFGLAHAEEGSVSSKDIHSDSKSQEHNSRPMYLPQEDVHHPNREADAYALGVLAYQLFTGTLARPHNLKVTIKNSTLREGINQMISRETSERLDAGEFASLLRNAEGLEQERRQRQTLYAALAASAFATLFLGLSFYILGLKNEAEHQKDRALANASALDEGLSLIADLFKLTDPNSVDEDQDTVVTQPPETVRAFSRLVIDPYAERFKKDAEETSDLTPEVYVVVSSTLAEIYLNLGLYDDADDVLHTAERRLEAFFQEAPQYHAKHLKAEGLFDLSLQDKNAREILGEALAASGYSLDSGEIPSPEQAKIMRLFAGSMRIDDPLQASRYLLLVLSATEKAESIFAALTYHDLALAQQQAGCYSTDSASVEACGAVLSDRGYARENFEASCRIFRSLFSDREFIKESDPQAFAVDDLCVRPEPLQGYPGHPLLAALLSDYGEYFLVHENDADRTIDLVDESLQILENFYLPPPDDGIKADRLSEASLYFQKADAHQYIWKTQDAERLYDKSLRILNELAEEQSSIVAPLLLVQIKAGKANLAMQNADLRDANDPHLLEAEQLVREALEALERSKEKNKDVSPHLAPFIKSFLAEIKFRKAEREWNLEQWDPGDAYFNEAYDQYSTVIPQLENFSPGSSYLADTYQRFADLLAESFVDSHREQAGDYARKALEIRQDLLAEESFELAKLYDIYGNILRGKGKFREAAANYQKALKVQSKNPGGRYNLFIADVLVNLANAQINFREFHEATENLKESRTTYQKEALNSTDWQADDQELALARIEDNLGWALELGGSSSDGSYSSAESSYARALEIRTRREGESANTALTYSNIARLHAKMGKTNECRQEIQQAQRIFVDQLSDTHWRHAYARSIAALCLLAQGNSAQARELLQNSDDDLATLAEQKGRGSIFYVEYETTLLKAERTTD